MERALQSCPMNQSVILACERERERERDLLPLSKAGNDDVRGSPPEVQLVLCLDRASEEKTIVLSSVDQKSMDRGVLSGYRGREIAAAASYLPCAI